MNVSRARFSAAVALALLSGFVATVVPREAHGCAMAYHARRIVLGSSGGDAVVLELDWDRFHEMSVGWRGPVRLGILASTDGTLRNTHELGVAEVEGIRDDEKAIGEQIRAGLAAARRYADFKPAPMPRHEPCDFESSCGDVSIAADAEGLFLSVDGEGDPLRVPLVLPEKLIESFGEKPPSNPTLASSLQLASIVRYDVAGRETLVVNVGTGDEMRGGSEAAFWPPCGCDELSRCPPVAATMWHGDQFEVVVPLETPPSPALTIGGSAPPRRSLDRDQLKLAEEAPKITPRTDGIYATDPVCDLRTGWSRRFLRFFDDGKVGQLAGNQTRKRAFRESARDSPRVVPEGNFEVVGRRVSVTRKETARTKGTGGDWSLDGILSKDGLTVVIGDRTDDTKSAHFSFTPLD